MNSPLSRINSLFSSPEHLALQAPHPPTRLPTSELSVLPCRTRSKYDSHSHFTGETAPLEEKKKDDDGGGGDDSRRVVTPALPSVKVRESPSLLNRAEARSVPAS